VTGGRRWPAVVVPMATLAAAVWSLVPVGVWWAGADIRYYESAWLTWLWGSVVALCGAALALLLTRGRAAALALSWWRRVVGDPPARLVVGAAAVLLAALALGMCLVAFSGNPRNVDGFAQLFQAREFLSGRVWVPPPPPNEVANFAILHMIVGPLRWFSQYPPGQSLVLAAGLALGAWWLLNPLFAVALVIATYRAARWCVGESAARLAVILLCLSPFVVAVSGSEMSHLPAATLGMLGAAAATAAGDGRWRRSSALAGAALGVMAWFRPLDAVSAAAVVTVILWLAAPSGRRSAAVAVAGIAGALFTLPLLWYNAHTTGSWHQLGYTYLWGPGHSLGFHPVPWGTPLTPLRAVGLTGLDFHQIDTYLFDAPFPVLVLVAGAYLLARRSLHARDAVPVVGAGALVGLLFFYWWRDVFYGPRFLFTAVPWLVILVARALVLLRRSGRRMFDGVTAGSLAVFTFGFVMLLGLVTITPGRLRAYRRATPVFDLHPDRDARRDGIRHAVVVIPDGWGSRLIARMWEAGVPAARSTRLYAAIDACALERALDAAAADAGANAPSRLLAALDSLAALHRPGVPADLTADPNLRLPARGTLAPVCRAELERDEQGFIEFSPFLYLNRPDLRGDIVWARDLGPWNAALFAHYPDRRLYRYAPVTHGGRPVFTPLPRAGGERAVR
jgi:hypothetical protein